MEDLAKQVTKVFEHFIQQEIGNRLSDFAWISFSNTVIKMIKEHKEVKKNDNSK